MSDDGARAGGKAGPDVTIPTSERRMVRRVLYHWERLRRGRTLPAMRDVNPDRLPVDWTDCFAIPLAAAATDPPFDFVGRSLVLDCDRDLTDEPVSAVPPGTLFEKATGCLAEALAERRPVIREGAFVHRSGDRILYRTVLLPFGDDGETVDYLLGAVSYRRIVLGGVEAIE